MATGNNHSDNSSGNNINNNDDADDNDDDDDDIASSNACNLLHELCLFLHLVWFVFQQWATDRGEPCVKWNEMNDDDDDVYT